MQGVLHDCRSQCDLKEFSNLFKYFCPTRLTQTRHVTEHALAKYFRAKWRLLMFMYFADYLAIRLFYMLELSVRLFALFDLRR